jgi:hypothetical protein
VCVLIVTCIPIARQRLGKRFAQHTYIARKRRGKHSFATIEEAVFSVWSVPRLYNNVPRITESSLESTRSEEYRRVQGRKCCMSYWFVKWVDLRWRCNWLWLREIEQEGVNKSDHPTQNPLLWVMRPRTRAIMYVLSRFGGLRGHRRGIDWMNWVYWPLVYTTRDYTLQLTDTHTLVSSVYYSLHYLFPGNRFNTQWRFFSFRGHAVARWLTLHTWPHGAIFSASLAELNSQLTAHLELRTQLPFLSVSVLCYNRRSVGQSN